MLAEAESQSSSRATLTSRQILSLYIPLALSWILMAVDFPVCQSIVSRRPDPTTNLAALQIFFAIAMWIESPVIDLLSTSTTLVSGRQSRAKLQRFTLLTMLAVTIVHVVVGVTPLFGWVAEHLLKAKPEVAAMAWPGFIAMVPWSAAIGWRRYLQGILIRNGNTRAVGMGTFARLAGVFLSAWIVLPMSSLPSTAAAGITLISGVICEMIFIHFAAAKVAKEVDSRNDEAEAAPLSLTSIAKFHAPLVLTTMVNLCAPMAIAGAIDRLPDPKITLAAFSAGNSMLWVLRSFTYALPEFTITLYKRIGDSPLIPRFCQTTGILSTLVTAGIGATGVGTWYLTKVLGLEVETAKLAVTAILLGSVIPLFSALQSYLRGMLTAHHRTSSRLVATLISMSTLMLGLVVGVAMGWPGITVGVIAATIAVIADTGVLGWYWRHGAKA